MNKKVVKFTSIGIILLLVIGILVYQFVIKKTGSSENKSSDDSSYTEEILDDEEDQDDEDVVAVSEDEAVYYGDELVYHADDLKYYELTQYLFNKREELNIDVPSDLEDFAPTEARSDNIYAIYEPTHKYVVFFEVEDHDGVYYVKASCSENSNSSFFKVSLSPDETYKTDGYEYKKYKINVEEVSYNEIKDTVTTFSEDQTPLTNNRVYAEACLEEYKEYTYSVTDGEQTEVYLEGYEGPVDVDDMMDYLGLNENKR